MFRSRKAPTCSKCGREHYNIRSCDDSSGIEQDRRKREGTGAALTVIENPEARGLKPWNAENDSATLAGGLTFVTGPTRWGGGVHTPDEAA